MSIDVFGHVFVENKEIIKGSPGLGFQLTNEGNFDIQDKILCNVADAIGSNDAVNLRTVEKLLQDIVNKFDKIEKRVRHLESQLQLLFADYNTTTVDTLESHSILSNRTNFDPTLNDE